MYEKLLLDQRGDALFVSFNNPRLHNAMDGQMLDEMIRLCAALSEDTTTRFVVFTGQGKSFMAGVDLKSDAMSVKNEPGSARLRQRKGQELVKRLRDLEQITVAAVNGACIGAGLAIAIACDLRIAAEDSTWSLPNTSLGYFFSWACAPLLASLTGPGRAKDLILTRRQLSGPAAHETGLAEYCVPAETLLPQAEGVVETMRAGGPLAMRMAKKLVNSSIPLWYGDTSTLEPELIERLYVAGEPVEGNAAFMERRRASWRDD